MRPLLVLLAALSLCPSALAAPAPSELGERLIALTEELEAGRLEHHVPGLAIAVVVDDEVVLAEGLGLADIEDQRPVDPRTVFAIGSTTKSFTSALAAMYVESRQIGWDEPLHWYLPELRLKPDSEDEGATVTFRDAFSHRSGFARMGPLWAAGTATPEQVYQTASKAEPVAPFRERFNYNNVTFTAGGDAVARAVGRPWDVLMRKRLLRPLGMRNATLSIERAAKDDHLAVGYTWDESERDHVELPMRDIHLVAPAGAINATVLDVARWVRFQLSRGVIDGKRLVSAEALAETWKPQIGIAEESAYGLGWMLHRRNGRRVVEHGGNIDGFAAQVTLFPDDGVGYALLMNTTAAPLQQLSISLVANALLETEQERGETESGALDLSTYVGDYLANFGPFTDQVFAVSVVNEKLHVDVPGQMNFELKPPDEEGKWVFAMTDQIAVSFDRNEEAQVTGLRMHQSGLTFELPRAGFEKEAAFPEEWTQYFGKYRAASIQQDVTVFAQNGSLALDVPSQMVFELKPPVEGLWNFRVADALQVRFDRDAAGRVVAVTQYRDGAEVESWPRIGDAPAAAEAAGLPAVRALVKADERGRALASLGGVRMRGQVRTLSSGLSGTVDILMKGADHFVHSLDQSPFLTVITRVSPEDISVESNVDAVSQLSDQTRRHARLGHPLSLFADWDLFFDEASYGGTSHVGDRATQVVKLRAEGLEPYTVHVDAETGDVLRVESMAPLGRGMPDIRVTTDFADHRDVGGMRLPYSITASNDASGSTVVTFDSIETGLAVDVEAFR